MNIKGENNHQGPSKGGDCALRTLEELPLAASLILTESGMYGGETGERTALLSFFPFGGFLTVTLANLMELRWSVDGEEGVVAVKMDSDL